MGVYGWAGRQGVKLEARVMAAPSRRGFALIFVVELFFTALFAAAFISLGDGWALAALTMGFVAGWATTRFLGEVSRWLRTSAVVVAVLAMMTVGLVARPVVAVGLAVMFAYFAGWFLTFLMAPSRAERWRRATRDRRR